LKNRKILGTTLIIIMLILMGLSIAMIASVSFPRGLKEYNNHYYFLIRQIIWLVAGSILFIFTANFEYTKYKRIRKLLYLIGFLMLLAVLGIGKNVNGATRWIAIGQFSIQPSEFAKLILILHLAGLIDLQKRKRENKLKMLFSILAATMTYSVLIIMEKAFSSTAQITLIGLTMMFISGVKMSEFLVTLLGLGVLGFGAITAMPYRLKRLLGHLKNSDEVYQLRQSLIAIGSGKLIGKFYGNGFQKYFYLPEIHTDYVFSGYAEEMGFVGSIILILLYMVLLGVILITIVKIRDMYAKYILIGILSMFSLQIIGNLAVVMGLVPSTGIPLPILSYGGSTTIVTMAALGIVYNIIRAFYRQELETERD
jgi:stage V sporulation protein E